MLMFFQPFECRDLTVVVQLYLYRRRICTLYQNSFIMDEEIRKQMSSTNKKEKIFNVRKLQYKQFEHNDKCKLLGDSDIKPQFSPFQVKDNIYEPATQKVSKKTAEYNFHLAIISSAPYKELNKKYIQLKEEQIKQKERRLQQLRQKQEQLMKCEAERERLAMQREKLSRRRDELKSKIGQIQSRNQELRAEQARRNQEYRILNMEYLRNMLMSMRYQNGIDIDIDNMSYQQLLQLQQKMGSVSKGLSKQQFEKLPKQIAGQKKQGQQRTCSICYDEVKQGQEVVTLPCQHGFHGDCIKEWLGKEKVCPLCKQQIKVSQSK